MNSNSPEFIGITRTRNGWALKTSRLDVPAGDAWVFVDPEQLGRAVCALAMTGDAEPAEPTNRAPKSELDKLGEHINLQAIEALRERMQAPRVVFTTRFPAHMGSIFQPLKSVPLARDWDLEVRSHLGGEPEHVDWLKSPATYRPCGSPFYWFRRGDGTALMLVHPNDEVQVLATDLELPGNPSFYRCWQVAVEQIAPTSVQQIRKKQTVRERVLTEDGWTRVSKWGTPNPGFFLTRNIAGVEQKVRVCSSGRVRWVMPAKPPHYTSEYLSAASYDNWDHFTAACAIIAFRRIA